MARTDALMVALRDLLEVVHDTDEYLGERGKSAILVCSECRQEEGHVAGCRRGWVIAQARALVGDDTPR